MKSRRLNLPEKINTGTIVPILIVAILLLMGFSFFACHQEEMLTPQFQAKKLNNSERFESKITPNGKQLSVINKLQLQGYPQIEEAKDLLQLTRNCITREEVAKHLNLNVNYLTQIIEEVDLLRTGMDVVTVQILQNIFYKNQNIHYQGTIDVGAIAGLPQQFAPKATHQKLINWLENNPLDFEYQAPSLVQLRIWFQTAKNLPVMVAYRCASGADEVCFERKLAANGC